MNAEVERRIDALISEIEATDEYISYAKARENVFADPVNASMICEYRRLRASLQASALAGAQPDEESVRRFSELTLALQFNSETSEYLGSELVYQNLVSGVMKKLSKITDIDAEAFEI